jgi:UDP-2,3-diacylglucosamine pyrophosphatase LpxH
LLIQRAVILPDIHLTEQEPAYPYQLAKRFIKDYKPDESIILGDFVHLESISHWIYDKKLLCENKRYKKEMSRANVELDFLQKHTKRVVYLEGNHEQWVTFYIEQKPEVQGLMEIPHMMDLHKRGIDYLPINKLYKKGKIYFVHGVYTNKYHAHKHLTSYGCCLCYGHTHSAQTSQMNMKMQDPIMAYGLGCLCDHEAAYRRGVPSNWINQFAVLESNTDCGNFNIYPINITKGQFIWNKRVYK